MRVVPAFCLVFLLARPAAANVGCASSALAPGLEAVHIVTLGISFGGLASTGPSQFWVTNGYVTSIANLAQSLAAPALLFPRWDLTCSVSPELLAVEGLSIVGAFVLFWSTVALDRPEDREGPIEGFLEASTEGASAGLLVRL